MSEGERGRNEKDRWVWLGFPANMNAEAALDGRMYGAFSISPFLGTALTVAGTRPSMIYPEMLLRAPLHP